MSRAHPVAALPIAFVAIRILIILNWLMGAAILALLLALPNEQWIMTWFKLSPSVEAERLVMGLRIIAIIGLVTIPLNHAILKRLVAMVETVRAGDPFVAANAHRLQTIAWLLLALQLLSLIVAAIAKAVSTPEHPLRLDAGFSVAGWLAVLLAFVLARVFAEGAMMRDDLEGTI
jgi:signal transduction histidine kinase